MIDISKREVSIPCPNCKRVIHVSLKQVVIEDTVTCSGCSRKIKLVDKDKSARKGVKDINRALSDFEKTLKSFGK